MGKMNFIRPSAYYSWVQQNAQFAKIRWKCYKTTKI
jgi:hypothetical protein